MYRHVLLAMLIPSLLSAQGLDDAARARDAVSRGDILRLSQVLPRVEDQFGGLVLDAVLVKKGSVYTYAFDILTSDARLVEVMVDAVTGKVIGTAADRRTGGSDRVRSGNRPGGGNDPDDDNDADDDDDGDDDDGDDDSDGRNDDSGDNDSDDDDGNDDNGDDGDDDDGGED